MTPRVFLSYMVGGALVSAGLIVYGVVVKSDRAALVLVLGAIGLISFTGLGVATVVKFFPRKNQ